MPSVARRLFYVVGEGLTVTLFLGISRGKIRKNSDGAV